VRHSQVVSGVTGEGVTRSTVPLASWTDDGDGLDIGCPEPVGPGGNWEVKQMAEKKITPKAASSTKTSSSGTAARVEKKSLKRHKKSAKRGAR
jgi:hypothetical protein